MIHMKDCYDDNDFTSGRLGRNSDMRQRPGEFLIQEHNTISSRQETGLDKSSRKIALTTIDSRHKSVENEAQSALDHGELKKKIKFEKKPRD
jgi:hypothetical protein